jgi:ribosomal-protein-alanine N-acetyltransferase
MSGTESDVVAVIAAEIAHIGVLAALHADSFETPWSANTFAELLTAPGAVGWLALVDGDPVGLAIGRITLEEAEVLTICVSPEGRRRGAARQLMRETLGSFDAGGARAAFLEVAYGNKAARALYHGLGFVAVGQRPRYYTHADGTQETALILRLDLR